nr:MAG: late control gene D protein [Bacteriophage sp.]
MINVSDAFKQKLQDGERVWQEVEITFPDGTVKTVKNEIMGENCTFSDCAESSSFPIGCVVCKSMTLELDNTSDQWKNYNFYMAKVHTYLKMQTSVASLAATDKLLDENYDPILDQSGGAILATKAATEDRVETIDKGIYTITTPEQYGEILSFTALDDMYKTNATYISHLVLPQSIETLVRDACETLGIPSEVSMAHGNLIVSEIPENMTFRQLFGWAAMLETANARLDSRGYLRFIRWDFSNTQEDYNAVVDADGNVTFKGGASIDSESFISPTGNWTIDSDGFLTLIESAADTSEKLKDFFESPTVSSDDIVITGIKLKNKENEAMYGSAGYVLELENDLVNDVDLDTVAAQIGDSIIGAKFRNMSGELAYNPLIEFGDMAYTYDRKWNRYITPLTDVSCFVNGKTTVKTQADDPIRGMSKFQSESTKAIVEARRLVKKEKTAREKAVEKLEETLKNSSGLYETSVTQEDGSTITYLHDKPTLAESKNVIKFTAEAIGVSNDGGKTYPYGFFLTGDLIAKILYAHGINADYIDTGALTVRDSDGNIIFQVDMDTKKVIISGDSVVIGGKTATKALSDNLQESKDYSDGKLADYADTVTGSLAGLQAQIDGQIESFFYDYEPSLQNKPASEWTSTEERKKHEGDLFYWKSTGYAYRFMQDGATWKWQMIQDNDISKALAQAEKAQDTADGKRRTFVIQPSPPYDIGDLWSQDGGDILTCVVARAKESVYASSDWKKLNKYTDDTTANKALEAAALAKNMTFQLSNDMQTITSDADGNIPVFPTVTTTAKVMYGSSDITNDCSYTITKSDSVTGSWDVDTHTYTVTGLSADNGWVDIKATYLINLSITKRFTISKQKSGKNGKQLYTWRKYASMPDGSDMSDSPDYVKLLDSAESLILDSTGDKIYTVTEAIYVGIADNKTTETPSDNPKDYIWSRFRGEDGADGIGIPGENGETSYIHTAYANSIDGTVDFSTTDTDRIYIGHYSDFEKTDSADPAKYTWARMRGEDGPPGRTYYLRANAGVLMMGQDKKITPNPFKVHAYYRDGQGDEATFKTWWVVEYSKDSGKTWTKLAFNVQTSGITINPDSYSLGADGMIRATIYTDSGRTKIADQQTWQVAVDVGMLTQEQIVEILSNDGEFKGLYYLNGHLYISLDALMGNAAILGGTKNGNGYLKIKDKKGTVKGLIDYSGYTAFTSYEENSTRMKYTGICFSDTGINPVSAEKYFSSTADIEYVETAWGIDWTAEELNISATEVSADTGTFGDLTVTNSASFTKSPKIEDMEYTTSSNTICWDGRTGYKQLMLKSSSSKRYKDIGNNISEQEIEEWYNIEPTWAKYKKGYLVKGDENEGRYIPMFIAENVEAFFPEATRHQNGLVEDWNERIMIPAMFAMLKNQKAQLDRQEKLIKKLYETLNIKEN